MRIIFIVKFVLLTLIVGFCINSCTLEKRRFRSGYYVNLKSNKEFLSKDVAFIKDDVILKKIKALEAPNFKEISKSQKVNSLVLNSFFKKNKTAKKNIKSRTKSYIQEHKHEFGLKQKGNRFKKITAFEVPEVPEEPEINLLGLASLILLLTGFLGILSIPMAIIAIRQFKKNPGKYKGIWAPVLALILPVVFAALLFTLLIASGIFSAQIGMFLSVTYIIALITIVGILHVSLH